MSDLYGSRRKIGLHIRHIASVTLCFVIGIMSYLSCLAGKPTMWFPTRSYTNRPVQRQILKQARSLKFCKQVEEALYYPNSENKGADQLCGYREADLRLCFRICRLLVFSRGGSFLWIVFFVWRFIKRLSVMAKEICT